MVKKILHIMTLDIHLFNLLIVSTSFLFFKEETFISDVFFQFKKDFFLLIFSNIDILTELLRNTYFL